jgi:hypothetical protein
MYGLAEESFPISIKGLTGKSRATSSEDIEAGTEVREVQGKE